MKAVDFEHANITMQKPEGMSEEDCYDVRACVCLSTNDLPMVVTKWEITEEDIEKIRKMGGVYLGIVGSTMPPAFVTADDIFEGLNG